MDGHRFLLAIERELSHDVTARQADIKGRHGKHTIIEIGGGVQAFQCGKLSGFEFPEVQRRVYVELLQLCRVELVIGEQRPGRRRLFVFRYCILRGNRGFIRRRLIRRLPGEE